jgi:type IV pilus assembly protein PilV
MLISKQPSIPASQQNGFSLLEVLISLVLIAVSLLGLTGMQSTALKQNHSAYQRSLAAQLAYDITDRMRVNRSSFAAYITNDPASDGTENADCLNNTGCTSAAMAAHDLFEWNRALTQEASLPLAQATITRIAAEDMFTITITWDDERDGIVDGQDPVFETRFHP